MWDKAANNLIVPGELTVNPVNNAHPLFGGPGGGGGAKLASDEFKAIPFN